LPRPSSGKASQAKNDDARVRPGLEDPIVRASTGIVGGRLGSNIRRIAPPWNVLRVLILLAAGGYLLGYLLDYSCVAGGWASPDRYEQLCYSDIPALFGFRGFAEGYLPYVQTPPGGQPLEYPVLTGLFMWLASIITTPLAELLGMDATVAFFNVNVLGLLPFLLVAVIATALTVRHRPWDAAMVALAPTMILGATINWDLIPIALTALAMLAWARSKPGWAGVALGLAIAAKFYPVLILGAFAILALRTAKWRPSLILLGSTVATWVLVNAPFAIANTEGWWYFYSFNSERGVDFGSLWYASSVLGVPAVPADALNTVATGTFLLLFALIAVLSLATKRRPRLAQVAFLVIAAFVLSGKVYSPQYVLWLVPLAAMARPRWRDFLIWQAGQVVYFLAIWWHLVGYDDPDGKSLSVELYAVATFVHIATTVYFAVMVIRDMINPAHDPVRTDGVAADADDPGGGPFDNAADAFTLHPRTAENNARTSKSTARTAKK
jgi:uncharacterized membrane protein